MCTWSELIVLIIKNCSPIDEHLVVSVGSVFRSELRINDISPSLDCFKKLNQECTFGLSTDFSDLKCSF